MDPQELAQTIQNAFESGDLPTAAMYLADDFEANGDDYPGIFGAREWIGLNQVLRNAFPDLSYNFQIESIDGNTVTSSAGFTGTHTGDLDLSMLGYGVIPATGKSISTARQTSEGTSENGKLKSLYFYRAEGSGIAGILAQLGIDLPG